MTTLPYRPEIDGLRAIAVLSVIFFHLGWTWVPGGFLGVDVFFVISGYLITSIIITDLENNTFNLMSFYERRARRLLPILFLVMLSCIPLSWIIMHPTQMLDFSQSLIATTTFVSNILFWREDGYFGAESALKPLLHTWSLAVEEQFYIVFPLFAWLIFKFWRNSFIWLLIFICLVSLVISDWGSKHKEIANFYLPITRAWELIIGSICAVLLRKYQIKPKNTLSLMGFTAVIFSIFIYSQNTPTPSLYTLLPIIGTAFIILFSHNSNFVGSFLSFKPIVFISLISYSLYLWHHPIIVFSKLYQLPLNSPLPVILFMGLLFSLSVLSWRYVETPFRKRQILLTNFRSFMTVMAGASTIFIMFGFTGIQTQGFAFRIPEAVRQVNSDSHGTYKGCPESLDICEVGNRDAESRILVYGDSHMNHHTHYIVEHLSDSHAIDIVYAASCFMERETNFNTAPVYENICDSKISNLTNRQGQKIDYIITSQLWYSYDINNKDRIREALDDRVKAFGIDYGKMIIFGANPVNPFRCLTSKFLHNQPTESCINYQSVLDFKEVSSEYQSNRISFIHPIDHILELKSYQLTPEREPIYFDDHHLSIKGSEMIASQLKQIIIQ